MLHPFQSSPNDQLHQILQNKKDMLPTLALKGVLISEFFRFCSNLQKDVQNNYPEFCRPKKKMLRINSFWHISWEIGVNLKKKSEIKPPLCDYPDSVLPKPWLNPK